MATLKTHHVIPNRGTGGWDIKKKGSTRTSKNTKTKQASIKKLELLTKIKILSYLFMEKMEKS